jgi:hypothetical protein
MVLDHFKLIQQALEDKGKKHIANGRTGILPEKKLYLKLLLSFKKYSQIATTYYKILTA